MQKENLLQFAATWPLFIFEVFTIIFFLEYHNVLIDVIVGFAYLLHQQRHQQFCNVDFNVKTIGAKVQLLSKNKSRVGSKITSQNLYMLQKRLFTILFV
jgi:hypothetical protein